MRLLLAGLLVLFCAEVCAAKGHVTFRVHAQANAQDGEPFSMQVPSESLRRAVTIEKMASISEREVLAFYPYRSATGSLGALVQLDDHGRLWLDTMSIEHRGSLLFIFVNGRKVAELQVDRRVSDGKIYIESGLSEADVAAMAKDWKLIGGKR